MRDGSRQSGKRTPAFGHAEPPVGHREQHHAPIRGQLSAIESGCDFLRETAGNEKGGRLSSVMAGEVGAVRREGWRLATRSYALSTYYATLASLKPRHRE